MLPTTGKRVEESAVPGLSVLGLADIDEPLAAGPLECGQGLGRHRVSPSGRPAQQQHGVGRSLQPGAEFAEVADVVPDRELPDGAGERDIGYLAGRLDVVRIDDEPGPSELRGPIAAPRAQLDDGPAGAEVRDPLDGFR